MSQLTSMSLSPSTAGSVVAGLKPAPAQRAAGSPWLPVGICLLCNAALFAATAWNQPGYLRDYERNYNPDARDYVRLGRNFLLLGQYSRCEAAPYVPDALRTPVYPLFAGGLDLLGGAGAIYLVQGLLQAASCWFLFQLVRPYFGPRAAFWASLLLATDLMLAVSNFEAMSELLFLFLALASAYCLIPAILPPVVAGLRPATTGGGKRVAVGGLLLALAILTRPAGLYLPLVYGLLWLGNGWFQYRFGAALRGVALFALVALIPVAAWVVRNAVVFSLPRLSTADAIMLVYFTGGGAYVVEHDVPLPEAHDRIAREFNLTHPNVTNNPWVGKKSVAEIDAELRQISFAVLTKYPRSLAVSCGLGVVKASVSHNVSQLELLTGDVWTKPDTGALLRARPDAFERLAQNSLWLLGVFFWQMAHTALTWLFGLAGVVVALRRRPLRPFALVLLLLLAYFFLTVALAGCETYHRMRTPHLPYLFAFTGLGLAWLGRREPALAPATAAAV